MRAQQLVYLFNFQSQKNVSNVSFFFFLVFFREEDMLDMAVFLKDNSRLGKDDSRQDVKV